MRVVLDTNVFVSGAINTGAPHSIVQTWLRSAALEAVICPRLLTEIMTVLLDRPTRGHGSAFRPLARRSANARPPSRRW